MKNIKAKSVIVPAKKKHGCAAWLSSFPQAKFDSIQDFNFGGLKNA